MMRSEIAERPGAMPFARFGFVASFDRDCAPLVASLHMCVFLAISDGQKPKEPFLAGQKPLVGFQQASRRMDDASVVLTKQL